MREQFTPGPWRVSGDGTDGEVYIDSALSTIACVYGGSVRVSQMGKLPSMRRANARLIAAAPELLALVYQYRDDMRHGVKDEDSKARRLEAIDAAIAKAVQP